MRRRRSGAAGVEDEALVAPLRAYPQARTSGGKHGRDAVRRRARGSFQGQSTKGLPSHAIENIHRGVWAI